jgi:hypothetical protein
MVGPPARVPVAGQVDRESRQAQRKDHRVPGVGVLAAAVQQDHPGRLLTPQQRADLLIARAGEHPADARRPVPRQARFAGVLVQQSELVLTSRHRLSLQLRSLYRSPAATLSTIVLTTL